ncbi:MAG: L,D-transpeptidase [Proteobacteria bacterium]|nr:L,D-transpeptidase [Pseudomonadota bacterium]
MAALLVAGCGGFKGQALPASAAATAAKTRVDTHTQAGPGTNGGKAPPATSGPGTGRGPTTRTAGGHEVRAGKRPPSSVSAATSPKPVRDGLRAAHERDRQRLQRLEQRYPLFGVAFHVVAQVFSRPVLDGVPIGYLRRGARFRAARGIQGSGCATTWHELLGGGFVCKGRGFSLSNKPVSFGSSSTRPTLVGQLPYDYARTASMNVPQYWRLPSVQEEAETAQALAGLAELEAELEANQQTVSGQPPNAPAATPAPSGQAALLETMPSSPAQAAPPAIGSSSETGAPAPGDLLPSYVRLRMQPGFYVSLAGQEHGPSGSFARTVRGGYVRSDRLLTATVPAASGVELQGELARLPVGIVYFSQVQTRRRDPHAATVQIGPVARRGAAFALGSERVLVDRRRHRATHDSRLLVPENALRVIVRVRRPRRIPVSAHWIHVDVEQQVVVAYEGDNPVFATLVSTGKPGFDTPGGLFRIQSKHISMTMDDDRTPGEVYSIEDVPWAMFFDRNFALHGAFWHNRFGRPRSHGCVNLSPADARWLFRWAGPHLPAGWHGIYADRAKSAAWVWVDA